MSGPVSAQSGTNTDGLNSSSNLDTQWCFPNCKYGGKAKHGNKKLPMVRCCLCMHWFHIECAKVHSEISWYCVACRAMPNNITRLLKEIFDLKAELNAMRSAENTVSSALNDIKTYCQSLQDENAIMKQQLADIQQNVLDCKNASMASPTPVQSSPTSFADVVRKTVKTAFDDEKVRQEVIVSRAPDEGNDNDFISGLCDKMDFAPKPKAVMRLGQNLVTGRCRPLKVSFDTEFDARTFKARLEQAINELSDFPKV